MTRAQSGAMDAAQYASRVKPFGSAIRDLRESTLLTVRTATGVESYILTPGGRADLSAKAADVLGNAVGAKAVRVDETPDLSGGPEIARMVARPNQSASRDAQAGADPAEVARTIARVAEPGSWVAVSLRRPSGKEVDRTREWNHKRSASVTHHSLDSEVLVASFFAGAASASSATFLLGQVVSALPGMDVDAVAKAPSDLGVTVGTAVGALALGGLGFAGESYLPGLLAEPLPDLATTVESLPLFTYGLLGAAPLAGVSALAGFHLLPTARQRLRKAADKGVLPRPATGGRSAPKPKPTQDGQPPAKVDNPYPLASTSFLVGPSVVAGVVAPQGGAEAGAATTGSRGAPPALREDIGPMIGTAGGDRFHLSAADFIAGVGIFGVPDSGKSVAIRGLYGWNVLERVSPSGKPGRPGRSNTLIAFENKGEGAGQYMAWAEQLGDHPHRIDLADPSTPAIDLFAGPATASAKAKQVAEAMQYAFPEGDIRRQSLSTITLVLTVSQFVTDQIAGWADLPAGGSVVEHAAVLLGAQGDEAGMKLATALKRAELEGDDPQLASAMSELAPLYGDKVTTSQRRQLQEAPRTKLETLAEASDWFAPDRPKLSWADILTRHENVVVNTGVSASGELVSAEVTTVIGSMLLYTLRDAIMRHCSGWKDQGRFVSIFVDELALLAAGSPEVVTWLRNQGRSYGISQNLATQYPDQLHEQVRKAVLSFGTIYWFRQSNPQIAEMAAEALSVDGSDWSKADVFNLPAHTAVISAQVNKVAQPAVPVAIGFWEDDRSAFPAAQGYPTGGRLPEPEDLPALAQLEDDEASDDNVAVSVPTQPEVGEEATVPAPEYEGDPFAPDRFAQ